MNFTKCKHCNELHEYSKIAEHMENCFPNWNKEIGLICCYSCELLYSENKMFFTSSQLSKEHLARCKNCIINNISKYAKYYYNYYPNCIKENELSNVSLNKQLEYYVFESNWEKINTLLLQGANPNYKNQLIMSDPTNSHKKILIYDINGLEKENNDYQPNTPLNICIFYLSNCVNTDADLENLYNIIKLLIKFGANKQDGLNFYKSRYGKINQENEKYYDEIRIN